MDKSNNTETDSTDSTYYSIDSSTYSSTDSSTYSSSDISSLFVIESTDDDTDDDMSDSEDEIIEITEDELFEITQTVYQIMEEYITKNLLLLSSGKIYKNMIKYAVELIFTDICEMCMIDNDYDYDNDLFEEGMYLLEERPNGDGRDLDIFGNSKDIIGYTDLLDKMKQDHKHYVDQKWVVKSRIFDLFIHDWDRHDDQWRWASFDKKDGETMYRPIARDRDQVFYRFRGAVPTLISALSLRKFKSFKHDLKDVAGQSEYATAC